MLNRNAEALFWIGRYMERAENHARLIDVHYHLQIDKDALPAGEKEEAEVQAKWSRIVDALGSRDAYEGQYGAYSESDVLFYATLDRDNPNSLLSCVSHARDNVRTLREKLPSELWDAANGFYLWLRSRQPEELLKESPHLFFGRIKEWTAMFQGVSHSVMPRENEFHFIECGKYLERAENTLRIIKSAVQTAGREGWDAEGAYPYLQAVLRSVSGYQPFRRYYADHFASETIMEFLLLSRAFPRSLHHSMHMLHEHLKYIELQDKPLKHDQDRMLRQVAKVRADMACLEREDLAMDAGGMLVTHLLKASQQLGLAFAKTFFRMGEASA